MARWLSSRFHSTNRLLQRLRAPLSSTQRGNWGESVAAKFLKKQGFKVIYRNFQPHRGGEIDLVCREGNTLVFVEVKTRSSEEFGSPAEAVNATQQHRISQGALEWLRMLGNPDLNFRFDIVEVLLESEKPACKLLRDAFPLSPPYQY